MPEDLLPTRAEQRAAAASNFPDEIGKLNLGYIRNGVEDILKLIGRGGIFHEYTLHDMSHVDAMLELLDLIVPDSTIDIMTPADWLLIVLACYFHDLGLLVTRTEFEQRERSKFPEFREEVLLKGDEGLDYAEALSDLSEDERERFFYQEFVRANHAERVFHWIMGNAREEVGASHDAVDAVNELLDGLAQKFREDLALICRSHHRDDLHLIERVYVLRRAYGPPAETHANLQYAALVLRTADLMQIQRKRTPSRMLKLIAPANPQSQLEWAKQEKVRAVLGMKSELKNEVPLDTFEVQADFDDASGFFGLDAYLNYARGELEQCYEWGDLARNHGALHEYPWRRINDDQVDARGFLKQHFEFKLDRMKILNLLTGHTLYNDSTVAVRELLQNSMDAVRFRSHANPEEAMGGVKISWSSRDKRLVVTDSGTGMTMGTIEGHLLNVGASFYQEDKFKEDYPDFSPISRFGIGVLSYFMISNDVEILTVHPDDESGHLISLPSATQRYLIKTLSKDEPALKEIGEHGTQVSIAVRASSQLKDIENIVRHWVVIPGCKVTLAVDGQEPQEIGYKGVKQALKFYVEDRFERTWSSPEPPEIRVATTKPGFEVAYCVRFSRWFRVWEFISRTSSFFREETSDDKAERLKQPPGVCVEGIRVATDPGGYTTRGLWTLVNHCGAGSPKTNVARSALEQSAELKNSHAMVYEALGEHMIAEFERLASEVGLSRASTEAGFMASSLLGHALEFDLARATVDALPVLKIEDKGGVQVVSRQAVRELDSIWTADGPVFDHIDGLCEALGLEKSSSEVYESVTGERSDSVYLPRFVGKGTGLMGDLEIKRIDLNLGAARLFLEWGDSANRWRAFAFKEVMLSSARHFDVLIKCRIALREIECNVPVVQVIKWRGFTLCLHNSPMALVLKLWKGTGREMFWVGNLLEIGSISDDLVHRCEAELRDLGVNPGEIMPKLRLRQENHFELDSFVREFHF